MSERMIRRMRAEDTVAAAALESLCFDEPWSAKALALLTGESALGVIVYESGRAVAYGGMITVLDEGQITNIAVHPDCRRRGFGEAVVRALIEQAWQGGIMSISLEVRESNEAAIALYEKLGFVKAGRRPHFYRRPDEAAVIMINEKNKD